MSGWWSGTILALYYLILGVLAAYGVHRLVLVSVYWRTRRSAPSQTSLPSEPRAWPVVTVQLPIFNEKYVATRLIEAACALDYPRTRLEIQVLDDSTDATRELVAEQVERLRAQGHDVHHLHRENREGFKAGALAAGLVQARGELIAVFDADFLPGPDFLRRTVPPFADPAVGMVQARWGHLNREYSLLTRVQAILLDGHFIVEHAARNRGGCFFNFNGTAGVWRREAIDDAGGWEHDTLTEDLDLSYRAQLAGWRFVFLPEVVVPAELPAEINAYKSQQHRWAKGSIQTGRKLLAKVLRAPLPWHAKLEALVHLTNNSAYLLMLALSVLVFPAMYLRQGASWWTLLAIDLPLFLAATVSVLIFYTVSQAAQPGPLVPRLLQLPALMGVGIGLAVSNSRAVISGFFEDGGVFHRTPKYNIEGTKGGWEDKSYRLRRGLSFYLEAAFALYFVLCFYLAWQHEMWLSLPFLYLFLQGYVYMTLLGLLPGLGRSSSGVAP
ncbi:MAG: glycosyltransferase [Thermoanaerobaculia bacterium]|nr:glycosyltransferase [Thermoanaerobaculia bacterium]